MDASLAGLVFNNKSVFPQKLILLSCKRVNALHDFFVAGIYWLFFGAEKIVRADLDVLMVLAIVRAWH